MAKTDQIVLDLFQAGLFSNRSPLTVPKTNQNSPYAVPHLDALIDGLNVEISPRKTLIRRPGFPTFCSSAFGSSEWPLAFWGGRISSTLFNLVDTQTDIYQFTSGSKTSLYTKTSTSKSYFQQAGTILYWSDGTVNSKWDGTNVSFNGVATPLLAPAIANLNFHDISGGVPYVHSWVPNYTYTGPATGISTIWLCDPNGNLQFAFLNANQSVNSGNSSPSWKVETGAQTVDGGLIWTNSGPVGTWATGMTNFKTAFGASAIQNLFSGPSLPASYSQSGSTATWSGTLPGRLTCASTSAVTSKLLAFVGFGQAVPSGCTILGIKADVTRHGSDDSNQYSGNNTDAVVKLLKAGTPAGSNKAVAGAWAAVTPTVKTYGSATDLWGTTWSDTDINDANFGLNFQCNINPTNGVNHHAFIDRVAITVYYSVGSISGAYTSTIVLDSNGNLQRIQTAGAVGVSEPTWSKTIGGTTTDSAATWECLGTGNILAAFVGWKYAYGFHTQSNHLSTMSPTLSLFAPIIGTGVTLTGKGSDDTQVDRNDLYRTVDGGSLLFYAASDTNVDSSTSWSIFDNIQDVSLNTTLVGPIAHVNDPPPAGLINLGFYAGRMWGSVGEFLYFTAGPDCTNGDPNQCWPPANVFPMPSTINKVLPTTNGLVVGLEDCSWGILGGPQTLTFFPQPLLETYGVLNSDAMLSTGSDIYMYTTGRQMLRFTGNGEENLGYPVADVLRTSFNPATTSMTIHHNGDDIGLLLSNGVDTVLFFSFTTQTWSPKGVIAGGIGIIESVETSSGTYTLLAGRVTGSGNILGRSLTSFLDGSSTYAAFAVIGSLPLAPPGIDGVSVKTIALQHLAVGTDLTVSVRANEIAGAFTNIPFTASDPFRLPATTSLKMRRFDWLGVQSILPNVLKHMQIKITFANEDAANELLALGVLPASV